VRWPQHYAMVLLGFMTGLRPSTLRPLRRRGAEPDVLWEKGALLVRRSETRGTLMNMTKTGIRYSIPLPEELLQILRWHVQGLNDAQLASDLLFPNVEGGFRAPTVLNKPLADVADYIGLGHQFTQRGMRRTYQDLARAAQISDLVTRSISGHATEKMQQHYSTVSVEERADAMRAMFQVIQGGQKSGQSQHPTGQRNEKTG